MNRRLHGLFVLACLSLATLVCPPVMAGEADVVGVKIIKEGTGTYRFDVTVRHGR